MESVNPNSGVCGKLCAHLLQEVLEVVTTTIVDHHLVPPQVCMLLVGRHPAALSYASSTVAAAQSAGVALAVWRLPETATNADVARQIALANADESIHGACRAELQPVSLPTRRCLSTIAQVLHSAVMHALRHWRECELARLASTRA